MKAAVFDGPGKMELRDVPEPSCGKGEVLIKVEACAICGTDIRIYRYGQKNVKPPHIIGHEIAGTVEKVGSGVDGIKKGERVVLVTSVGCGKCKFCHKGWHNLCSSGVAIGYYYQGGFAEYMQVPEPAVTQGNILPFPGKLSFAEASIVEPLSCCINGQEYLGITPEDTVVIFGCGPIGCMHAELVKAKPAQKLIMIDVDEKRLKMAEKFAPDIIINASQKDPVEEILSITDGGADAIIVACGVNKVQEQAIQATNKKGRISFFAGLPKDRPTITLDSNIIHYKEISLFGAFASYEKQFREALGLIVNSKVNAKKIVTHKFALEKIVEAIEVAASGEGLKIVIEPWL